MNPRGTLPRVNTKTKNCARCGREMTYRKRWASNWDQIKYCSERCRKPTHDYAPAILKLLDKRAAGLTICPSELLPGEDRTNPDLMEQVRQAARRLVHEGLIEIVQRGQVVDPSAFRGPIRLRKR